MARARAGDEEAYAMLVGRHQDVAFRLAWLLTGSAADAEETAQDAFVSAYRALDRFREGSPFRPWVLAMVRHGASNRRRAASRRVLAELRLTESAGEGRASPSPERAAELAEGHAALLRALGELDEDARQVVVCRYLMELSVTETGVVLDCPEGTVKSRLSRALLRLREQLGEEARA